MRQRHWQLPTGHCNALVHCKCRSVWARRLARRSYAFPPAAHAHFEAHTFLQIQQVVSEARTKCVDILSEALQARNKRRKCTAVVLLLLL